MPIYQYLCAECGNRFQQRRKVTERSLSRCPTCGGRAKKLFGAVGIIFKGSGFHATDYRKPEDRKPDDKKPDDAKPAKTDSTAPAKTGVADSD